MPSPDDVKRLSSMTQFKMYSCPFPSCFLTCRRSNSAQAGEPREIEAQNTNRLHGVCRQCQPHSNGTSSGCDSGTELHTYAHTYSHNHVSLCHAKAHMSALQTTRDVFSDIADVAHADLSPGFDDGTCSPAPLGMGEAVLVFCKCWRGCFGAERCIFALWERLFWCFAMYIRPEGRGTWGGGGEVDPPVAIDAFI